MIWILCIFLLYSHHFVDCTTSFPSFPKLSLLHPANGLGSESLDGPYAGVVDGRVLKYQGPHVGFVDFATTSPWRTKKECDGTNGSAARTCGRPAGLGFDYLSGNLYVLDSNFGFQVVPPSGGLGIPLATGFNVTNFSYLNALDIDRAAQNVYFTDAGKIFLIRNITDLIKSGDTSGKLYEYNIKSAKLTFLSGGLSGPIGLAVSEDGKYLVISEYIKSRIRGHSETLIYLPGSPDNIKRTIEGDFWVAVTVGRSHRRFRK